MLDEGDPREAEWRAYEAGRLAEGRCPYSGEVLHRDGDAGPNAASCDMCDCFGYDPELVKVWPRPLRVVRWKVTRMRCASCGKPFAGDKHCGNICYACFSEALGFNQLGESPF